MPLEKEKLISAKKARQLLISGDFPEYLKYLYQLGAGCEKDFILNINHKKIFEDKSQLERERQNYIQNQIDVFSFNDARELLNTTLQHLLSLAVAWEDPGLSREKIKNSTRAGDKQNETPKKIRQSTKLKKDIDKSIRHAIRVGLMVEVARLRNETIRIGNEANQFKIKFDTDLRNNERTNPFNKIEISSLEEKKPYEILAECINSINGETPKDIEQIFKKAANAILSFKSLSDKVLQALGVFIAFLAALACGLTVGGCAYLLFMGLTPVTFFLMPLIPAAIISIIGASIVFGVNFSYLYKSIPEVLLSAAKMGGITEYIDPEGKRAQLSRLKKILLLPAAIVSFAVGVSMMAFTATNFISILAGIIPALALSAAPPFLPILLGILIVGLGVALSILMFKGFVWLLQKPLIKLAKQALDHMKKLSFLGWLGLSIKLLIFGLSVVGIYALYFAGIPILVPFFGPAAVLIGWASFFGELPFTLMVVSQLCDLVGSFLANNAIKIFNFCFTRQNVAEQLEDTSTQEKTSFKLVIGIFFVTINAFLNALLVIGTTIISLVATGACFVNSFASNLIVPNSEQEIRRNKANDACLQALMPKNKEVISSRQNDNLDAGRNEPLIISSSSLFITPKSAQQNMNGYCANNMVTPQTVGSTRYNAGL
ncbi:hypothetical protein [Rickettsiella endosymbiont of Aleochara curtula]|uniref:hypothetical protein n=1 Tax=Rickettsiella endosymbiont of Aleochara curtula TaxID=3077936 RepID=UPI00313C8401